MTTGDLSQTALLICDLQNDFIHPEGAYGRAGQGAPDISALPGRIRPLFDAVRSRGGMAISTLFTLVPGRGGEPMIAPHLRSIRPFLKRGDFAPGSWGQATVDELQPVDVAVEKVAYSAFYMSRLEWVIRKLEVTRLLICGIVTNGGVASTFREAHVRELDAILLEDGCAAFSPAVHRTAVDSLRPVGRVASIAEILTEVERP